MNTRGSLDFFRRSITPARLAEEFQQALARLGTWTFEIVRRSDAAKGFQPLLRRWVVERSIAWLNRNCRLAGAGSSGNYE